MPEAALGDKDTPAKARAQLHAWTGSQTQLCTLPQHTGIRGSCISQLDWLYFTAGLVVFHSWTQNFKIAQKKKKRGGKSCPRVNLSVSTAIFPALKGSHGRRAAAPPPLSSSAVPENRIKTLQNPANGAC